MYVFRKAKTSYWIGLVGTTMVVVTLVSVSKSTKTATHIRIQEMYTKTSFYFKFP